MQQSDRHSAVIKRDHVRPAGGKRTQRQIYILQSSNEITYALQEGGERSVRSKLCSHQTKSRTACRRGRMLQSDRRSAVIKRDHVRPAGGRRIQQSDRHSAVIKRNHVRSAGEGRMQQSDRHSVVIKRDHVQPAGGERMQRQIDILQSSHEITYGLQEGGGKLAESDQHSVVIKRDHVQAAGGRIMQQSDRHSVVIKRDYIHAARECSRVRLTLYRPQTRLHTPCRSNENAVEPE